jgi:alpha-1,3-rhamnosyltransferase
MNQNMPLVSVIMPSYNHEKYIRQSIEGIAAQTYTNFEFIVVDDGSKDNSVQILQELKGKYNFQLILQQNKGLCPTLNNITKEKAKGKYISVCASDDIWTPEKLELQVNFMEQNPQYGICFGKAYTIDENSQPVTSYVNRNLKGGYIFDDLLVRSFHPPVNYLYRADVLKDVGYWREDVILDDFYMNLKIAEKYPFGFLDEFLFSYRVHSENTAKRNPLRIYNSQRSIIDQYKSSAVYNKAIAEWHFRRFYECSAYKKTKLNAIRSMFYSLGYFNRREFKKGIYKLITEWR